ncbi:hypothetical protein [Terrarubrum flagellatum]|uniref:hypothetical protein n=1 Tax=Terrirubrum flagellatum TaxID=2895980 RepID=UPI00314534BC
MIDGHVSSRASSRRTPTIRSHFAALGACALASLFAWTAPVGAQSASSSGVESYLWRPVAIGGGGFITGYDSDPTGATRVIRTDVYGAYLWLAREDRWAQLVTSSTMPEADQIQNGAAEGVYEIVVAPSKPDRIYMAINGRIYRSDNRGAKFERVSRSGPFPIKFDANGKFRHYGPFMAVGPNNPDLVFFGTPQNGLLRSEDGGATWQNITSVPRGGDLSSGGENRSAGVLPWFEHAAGGAYTGRVLAMSAGNGVFVSADGGRNFAPLAPAEMNQPRTLKQAAYAPDGTLFGVDQMSKTVWRFRSGAWTDLTGQLGAERRFGFASVAINPRTAEIFVFDEGGGTSRSMDGGESWTRVAHHSRAGERDPPWLRIANVSYFATGRVTFDPVVPNRMINGAGTGVYIADVPKMATDILWTSQTRGVEELVANDVIQAPGQAPLFAAWDFGIHVKDDLNSFSKTYGPKERVVIAAQALDWSPSDPKFVVTNASDTRTNCCSQDGQSVLAGYSADGGRNWTRFATLPQPPGTRADDPWRMSFGAIAISSNDVNNIIWAPTYNRSPFYTKDRGATWRRVELSGERLPNTGSHALYYSQRKILAADRVLPSVFYYYHSGDGDNAALRGLWRTRDGGETWAQVFNREIAPQSKFTAKLRAVPGKAGNLFFTSAVAQGDVRLRRSVDGGENWTIVANVDHVDDIGFGKAAPGANYPAIFISGRVNGAYGVWRSTDDAASWKRVGRFPVGTLDQVTVVEGDKDHFGRVYVGYKGSGWRYGEPANCSGQGYVFPNDRECLEVRQ